MVQTKHWRQTSRADEIICDICPRHCRLRPGQKGFCFVRENENGTMRLSAHSQAIGLSFDPMEKKPLYHFYPGRQILSFGTAGCNLGCRFCQNWHMSRARQIEKISHHAQPRWIAQKAHSRDAAVAFTYNDPVIFYEYAIDTALECRQLKVPTVAVTAGYMSEQARPDFFAVMDAANVDLKSFQPDFYRKLCQARLEVVLETLQYIVHETSTWLEITTLLIPSWNDTEKEIRELSQWIAAHLNPDIPLHLSAFHPDGEMTNTRPTPAHMIQQARQWAMQEGLRYVYTGNIRDPHGSQTYCPNCGQTLIERQGYQVNFTASECERCHTKIPGIF